MGESIDNLYKEWLQNNLKETGSTLQEFILEAGIDGLLYSFASWLLDEGYVKPDGSGSFVKRR